MSATCKAPTDYDDRAIERVNAIFVRAPHWVRPTHFAVPVLIWSAIATTAAAQTPRLSVTPAVVRPGSIVRLTLTAPTADPVKSIRGEMAGEELHFLSRESGIWRAIGGIPVDARDSVAAHVIIERRSGSADTSRAWAKFPPPPRARPGARRARPRRLSVDSRFTRPLDAETRARIDRENERA